MHQNKDVWSWIISHIRDQPTCEENFLQQNRQHSNRALLQLHGFRLSPSQQAYKELQNYKLYRFKKIIDGEREEATNNWDSDDDLSNVNVHIGDKVDVYHPSMNKFVMGIVESSLEEMIDIKYNVPRGIDGHKWYTLDNEYLAPGGTLLEN